MAFCSSSDKWLIRSPGQPAGVEWELGGSRVSGPSIFFTVIYVILMDASAAVYLLGANSVMRKAGDSPSKAKGSNQLRESCHGGGDHLAPRSGFLDSPLVS